MSRDTADHATSVKREHGAPEPSQHRLKILTWNIWMMPGFTLSSPQNRWRAAAIAEEILKLDYDIVCFEKAFDSGARAVILEALKGRYKPHGPANSGFAFLKVNSGVWVLSRVELSGRHEIQYRDCAGIECFSRKGAMLLSGTFEGHPFQIVVTHLQGETGSHYTPGHQQIRNRQMTQLQDELLTKYAQPGVPLFLCGDFDTPRLDPKDQARESDGYRAMLKILGNPQNDRNRSSPLTTTAPITTWR